jgi:DNA-binding LytR/AlgR family response regulator
VLLAEDDPVFADLLVGLLAESGDVDVVGCASDGRRCLDLAEDLRPDLVVLDVDMPEIGGVEAAEVLVGSAAPPLVVFVTAYPEHAARAFRLRAVDYIVKPTDLESLGPQVREMLERVRSALQHRDLAVDELRSRLAEAVAALDGLAPSHNRSVRGRIAVKDHETQTVRLLATRRITHAVRDGKHVELASGGERYRTYYTIERLVERLAPDGFARVNRSTLANLAAVDHLVPNGDGSYDVFLVDGTRLEASRGCSQALLKALQT